MLFVALAQALSPKPFESIAVALGALVAAQAIGDFGLSQAAVTALPAELAARPDRRNDLIAGAARASLIAAVCGSALTVLLGLVVGGRARDATILIAPAAGAAVVLAGMDGLLRAEGEFRRPVVLVVMSRLGSLAGLPVAAVTDSAAVGSLGVSIGTVVASTPALIALVRVCGLSQTAAVREFVRSAVPLGFSQLLVVGSGRLNTVILSAVAGIAAGAAFEGGWRIYQLFQYLAGGLVTALAPLIGHAIGAGESSRVRTDLCRTGILLFALGIVSMAALLALRYPVARMIFGEAYGSHVADALLPLALVTPVAFVGFLAAVTLSVEAKGRRWLLGANAAGALANIVLVAVLAAEKGAPGGAAAAAAGVAVTSLLLVSGLIRRARSWPVSVDVKGTI